MKKYLRSLPPIHEIQKDARFESICRDNNLDALEATKVVQSYIEEIRHQLIENRWRGSLPGTQLFLDELFQGISQIIEQRYSFSLKTVINATGTILHTNLGRARLSKRAVQHVVDVAQNYSNLEYYLEEGKRGSRHQHVESLLKIMTGAKAVMVVNNNAAAVFLILTALSKNKEVIVSRGQLVEIGGSFRISSIMEQSGVRLVEVGTTNKTHLVDYEQVINENTSMIMKVHTSNFKMIGFTKSVETFELAALCKNNPNLILYEDLGSGALYDFRTKRIGEEPTVSEVLNMGADIVSFSGDKLLGGPQAGIIAGRKCLIDQLKKHQLARVVRVDKMSLAALEGTLLDYVKSSNGKIEIPTIRDMLQTEEELKKRVTVFADRLQSLTAHFICKVRQDVSQVGGGTMPEVELPTYVLTLKHVAFSADQLARILRMAEQPIIVRIKQDEIIIDLRTVAKEEEEKLLHALIRIEKR